MLNCRPCIETPGDPIWLASSPAADGTTNDAAFMFLALDHLHARRGIGLLIEGGPTGAVRHTGRA